MLNRDDILYLLAILENCGQFTLKKDPRTGSVYPYIRLKITKDELRCRLKEQFGGTISKHYLILSHRKAKSFLDILPKDESIYREKIELVQELYSKTFARPYQRAFKDEIYKKFKRLEDGDREGV